MSVPMEQGFPVGTAMQVTGNSFDQLRDYDRKGYVKPSVSPAEGRGSLRLYSYTDIVVLRVVSALRDLGVTPTNMQNVMAFLREHHGELRSPEPDLLLVTDSRSLFVLTHDPQDAWEHIRAGRFVLPLPLGQLIVTMKNELRQTPPRGQQNKQMTFAQVANA